MEMERRSENTMAIERKHDSEGAKLPSLLRHRIFAPSPSCFRSFAFRSYTLRMRKVSLIIYIYFCSIDYTITVIQPSRIQISLVCRCFIVIL